MIALMILLTLFIIIAWIWLCDRWLFDIYSRLIQIQRAMDIPWEHDCKKCLYQNELNKEQMCTECREELQDG